MQSKHPKVSIPVFRNPIVFYFSLYYIPCVFFIPLFCISVFQTGHKLLSGALQVHINCMDVSCLRDMPLCQRDMIFYIYPLSFPLHANESLYSSLLTLTLARSSDAVAALTSPMLVRVTTGRHPYSHLYSAGAYYHCHRGMRRRARSQVGGQRRATRCMTQPRSSTIRQ
jgi:hypothetical protein